MSLFRCQEDSTLNKGIDRGPSSVYFFCDAVRLASDLPAERAGSTACGKRADQ